MTDFKSLEEWLHRRLKPLCVADPIPLSQYVIALIKKDKPEQELKDICVDQLEVFLQNNTADFVDALFSSLRTRSYISSEATVTKATNLASTSLTSTNSAQPRSSSVGISGEKRRGVPELINSITAISKPKEKKMDGRRGRPHTRSRSRSNSPLPSDKSRMSRTTSRGMKRDRHSSDSNGSKSPERHEKRIRGHHTSSTDRHRSTNGDSRRSRLSRERNRSPERSYRADRGYELKKKSEDARKRVCRNFAERGFCTYGERCAFEHIPSSYPSNAAPLLQLPVPSTGINIVTDSLVSSQPIMTIVTSLTANDGQRVSMESSGPTNSIPIIPVYKPTPIKSTTSTNRIPTCVVDSNQAPLMMTTSQSELTYNWPQTQQSVVLAFTNRPPPNTTFPLRHNMIPLPKVQATSCLGEPPITTVRAPPPPPNQPPPPPAYEPDHPQISADQRTVSPSTDLRDVADAHVDPPMTYTPSPISDQQRVRPPIEANLTQSSDPGFPKIIYITRIPWSLNDESKLRGHFIKFGALSRVVTRYFGIPDTALIEYMHSHGAELCYRSPEPILSNRFIRLSLVPPSKFSRKQRGRQTPYDMRPKTLAERLGARPAGTQDKYDWLRFATDVPTSTDESTLTMPSRVTKGGGRSRWRLERGEDGARVGSGDEEDEEELDDSRDGNTTMQKGQDESHRRGEVDYALDRSADLGLSRHFNRHGTDPMKSYSKTYNAHKQDLAAYSWQQQKTQALKQRQEQLKLLDKARETKKALIEAQKQRINRLKVHLQSIMAQLQQKTQHGKSADGDIAQSAMLDRKQLLTEAKQIQSELESAIQVEKKLLSNKLKHNAGRTGTDGMTSNSTSALQALPEPVATARREQIAQVRAALKEAEDDMAKVRAKEEPITEHRRRIFELKRQLVELETIRPSDLDAVTSGERADNGTSTAFSSRTKLDKRPRTVYVCGLRESSVTDFQQALSLNYLHTQSIVKHSTSNTGGLPILEILFCTRDFAEAAMRQFTQFQDQTLSMSFAPPPSMQPAKNMVTTAPPSTLAEAVSSTQLETNGAKLIDSISDRTVPITFPSHPSPTSTTISANDI